MATEQPPAPRPARARRTVFLTGASAGIGLATARLLSAAGFEVWGSARDPARLPTLPGFHPVAMDLLEPDSIRAAFPREVAFDVLINNAGAAVFGPLESMPAEVVREQFQLLVFGPLELIRLVLPSMRERGSGLILNVTSLAGRFGVPFLGGYNAGKAALSSISRTLRMELAHTPIRVVDIQPGDIRTNFHSATRHVASPWPADQRRIDRVWETELRNNRTAPPPELVAKTILRVIRNPRPPPVVTVGGFFQARLGPFAARFASAGLLERLLRRLYRL
jgi:NAD(P)-dependent dehydrogenase (short-subunit alcohol dehydrogenase family)